MANQPMDQKKHISGGVFSPNGQIRKINFFSKKNFFQIFSNFFLAHPKRNLFLILKWFYFLIFAQNWPICEGFCFSFLKIDFFPLWWGGPPGAPWGVKIFPKMVPMIIIGHIIKVYDEKWAKKNFFFQSVWLYKYSPYYQSRVSVQAGCSKVGDLPQDDEILLQVATSISIPVDMNQDWGQSVGYYNFTSEL